MTLRKNFTVWIQPVFFLQSYPLVPFRCSLERLTKLCLIFVWFWVLQSKCYSETGQKYFGSVIASLVLLPTLLCVCVLFLLKLVSSFNVNFYILSCFIHSIFVSFAKAEDSVSSYFPQAVRYCVYLDWQIKLYGRRLEPFVKKLIWKKCTKKTLKEKLLTLLRRPVILTF